MKRRLGDEQTIQMIKGQEPGERTGDVCRRDGMKPDLLFSFRTCSS